MTENKPFVPEEEIKKVKSAEASQMRRDRHESFSAERSMQREIVADFSAQLIKDIEQDPEIKIASLNNRIDKFEKEGHASPNQLEVLRKSVDLYEARHAEVQRIVELYPNPENIFRHYFGFFPKGEFQLRVKAANIHIILYNEADYNRVAVTKKAEDGEVHRAGGTYFPDGAKTTHNVRSKGVISIEFDKDQASSKIPSFTSSTEKHETMHALNRMFLAAIKETGGESLPPVTAEHIASQVARCPDKNIKREILNRAVWQLIFSYDFYIKDEFLSYIKGGYYQTVSHILSNSPMYKYFNKYGNRLFEALLNDDYDIAKEVWDRIFNEEYPKYLDGAAKAVDKFIREYSFGTEKTIMYLAPSPVWSWAAEARRYKSTRPERKQESWGSIIT
jgi:hypothetical protein